LGPSIVGKPGAVAPEDTMTVTVSASLPSTEASRAQAPRPNWNWNPEEDEKLIEVVKELGKNWARVAAMVPGRTNRQCRRRWSDYLDPTIDQTLANMGNKGKWTTEEDAKLTGAVKELGKNWARVAALVPDRTNRQCRHRWVACLDPIINSGKWTVQEIAKLTDAVTEHGGNNWAAVAVMVPGRTNRQCRQRWVDSLDPIITTGKWTVEEDARLTDAVKEHGENNWTAVAAMVPGRFDKQCRRRWVDSLDPVINTGSWTVEEDAKLTAAINEHGENKWAAVAELVPGRIKKQCRQRWTSYLSPEHSPNARSGT
jgi:myb proto-oncogene protein